MSPVANNISTLLLIVLVSIFYRWHFAAVLVVVVLFVVLSMLADVAGLHHFGQWLRLPALGAGTAFMFRKVIEKGFPEFNQKD